MNILHVEQNQIIREMVSESVSEMGHDFYGSQSSSEAFKILQAHEIHFIISGLELTDVSGAVLVESLAHSKYQDVPVLVLASDNNFEIRKKLSDLGVVDYLIHDKSTAEKLSEYLVKDRDYAIDTPELMSPGIFGENEALRITMIYILLGCLWILFSDKIMDLFLNDKESIVFLSMLKGWMYIIATGAILYILVSKALVNKKDAEKSDARLKAFFNVIPDLMFKLNGDGVFLDYIAAEDDKLYAPPEAFIGKNIKDVLPPEIVTITMHHIQKGISTKKIQCYEYGLNMHGEEMYYEARMFVSGEDETTLLIRDITLKKKMALKLEYNSLHDNLTGLSNRTYFEEKMASFDGAGFNPVGLMISDIDGLKFINDTMGHLTGDRLLVEVADIFKRSFENSELIARIGGDEFAAIIPDCNEKMLEAYRKELIERVKQCNNKNINPIISISMGFAIKEDETQSMYDIYKEADNNMYREKLNHRQSARNAIVQGLMTTLEARDLATENHAQRLQQYVLAMTKRLNLPEGTVNNLQLLAQFHDIGKVGIPDKILLKEGPLTPDESIDMQAHSEIGHKIALSIPGLGHVSDLILKHHEWWNGKGYPLGLKQEEIPLECRILSIADAYDAMISNRPYRKGIPLEKAREELEKNAGIQFDPDLVTLFMEILESPLDMSENEYV